MKVVLGELQSNCSLRIIMRLYPTGRLKLLLQTMITLQEILKIFLDLRSSVDAVLDSRRNSRALRKNSATTATGCEERLHLGCEMSYGNTFNFFYSPYIGGTNEARKISNDFIVTLLHLKSNLCTTHES